MATSKRKPRPPERVFLTGRPGLVAMAAYFTSFTEEQAKRQRTPGDIVAEFRLVTKEERDAERAVGLGEIAGFGVDPKDSVALLELRQTIDCLAVKRAESKKKPAKKAKRKAKR